MLASPSRLLRFFARASLTTNAAACPVGLRRLNPPCSPLAVARRCWPLRIGGGFSPRVDAGASSGASFERRVYERRVVGVDAGASSGVSFLRRVYERRWGRLKSSTTARRQFRLHSGFIAPLSLCVNEKKPGRDRLDLAYQGSGTGKSSASG